MEKENQRIKLTKRMLRDALLLLLQQKPLQKINVSELCEAAGLNRATFYRHYNVPNDILNEMLEQIISETRSLSPIPKNSSELQGCIVKLCKYIGKRAEIIKVIIKYDSDFNLMRIFEDHIYEILRTVRIRKNDTVMDEESIKLIASYCAGGGYQLLRRWLTEDIPKAPEEIAETIIVMINKNITWRI